jgi:hypothetical protein
VLIKEHEHDLSRKAYILCGGVEVTLRNAVEINPDRMELEYSY